MTTCCFAQITDLHLSLGSTAYGPEGDATLWVDGDGLHERVVTTPEVLAALLDAIARDHPEVQFVVATGDLTNNGHDDEFAAYRQVIEAAPLEVVSIPGNHDHHQAAAAAAAGEPLPYERFLGPRWFSFDRDGVHFAAIDWYTHRLGVDTAVQDEWLAADLAAVDAATPVVLLTHDQMPMAFFDGLPRRPVASFSGHWHTSRIAADGAGTLHVNTGNATFGGLDYSPPHYRVCTVDGHDVHVSTEVRGDPAALPPRRPSDPSRWVAAVGAAPMAVAAMVDGLVVVTGAAPGGGVVTALDARSGELVWRHPLAAEAKAGATVAGDGIIAVSVTGELVHLDAATGAVRWRAPLHPDPLHLWCYVAPMVHGGLVFAGDVGAFAAHDLATGTSVWSRDDLGRRENLTTFAGPVVVDGVLVGTFAGQSPALFGLDPGSGATRWPPGGVHGIYESGADLATELPRVVVGGITADPDDTDVFAVRLGSRVERLRAAEGDVVWSAPFFGWFNPAPPVVVGDTVVATAATGSVWCFDRATGEHRWHTEVATGGPVAMGSYRADGASVLAPVTVVGDRLLQPTSDGRIVTLDPESGAIVDDRDIAVPVAARLAVVEDDVITVAVDGTVRRLPLS